jgi:peptide/nickel transport system ATP-binding protein
MTHLLSTEKLNVSFYTEDGCLTAVKDTDISIKIGARTGLVGETGCGKTVLGQAVLGLLPKNAAVSGKIYFDGKELLSTGEKERRRLRLREIALIAQNPAEALDPLMRVGEQLMESIRLHQRADRKTLRKASVEILRSLHFPNPDAGMKAYPHELSGGMKQRVLAAMGMVGIPKFLIADEPTKGLDAFSRGRVADSLRMFLGDGKTTALIITHDLLLARWFCDEIAVMYAGEIVEKGKTEAVFSRPRHPYTQALIAAQPQYGCNPIPGECASLYNLPSGCHFYERCDKKADCPHGKSEHPPLYDAEHEVRCFCYD